MKQSFQFPFLLLWLNSGCNARCKTCEIWRDTSKTFITAEEISTMVPHWQTLGVKEVELCGEPTIHPEIAKICAVISGGGIRIRFLSNGLRLEKYAPLVAQYGHSLTVSLDGPPQVHDQVRNVPNAFSRLARGVAAVRKAAPDLPVYGRCAVHNLNFKYLCDTYDTAKALGLADISYIGLDVSSPAFGRDGLPEDLLDGVKSLVISREQLPELEGAVESLISHQGIGEYYIREAPDRLRDVLVGHYTEHWSPEVGRGRSIRCNAPWTSAVIEPDGAVRPCWFLPPYGKLSDFSGDLAALLDSPAARRYRASIDLATNPTCRTCISPRTFDAAA